MKLYHSPTSPFVRKVMACAIARGIEAQITLVPSTTRTPEVEAVNPVGKLPCLVTDDGLSLYDSRVICEFLDSVGDVYPLFPEHGPRIRALRFQALGDGIMDAAVLRRGEQNKPRESAREAEMQSQGRKVTLALDVLEHDVPANHLDIGTITIACALGYLDLRFGSDAWREGGQSLPPGSKSMMQRPCMIRTIPG